MGLKRERVLKLKTEQPFYGRFRVYREMADLLVEPRPIDLPRQSLDTFWLSFFSVISGAEIKLLVIQEII